MRAFLRGIWLSCGIAASVSAQTQQFEANGPCGGAGDEVQVYDSHGFSYRPVIPTDQDSISLAIFGDFPSSGYSVARALITQSEDTVFVDASMSFAGGVQMDSIVPWAVRACLPPRSERISTISITIEQEGPRGTRIRRLTYPIAVIPIPGPAPLKVFWVMQGALSEALGLAQVETSHTVGVVPTAEWSGELTRMWFSIPSAALSVKEGSAFQSADCQSQFRTVEVNSAELDIQCVAWEANSPIFSFEVTVSDQFSGWADIRMDSLEVHGERMSVGDTARLLELAVGSSLVMDFNSDQRVDFNDFFIFADAFGSSNSFFDFNSNGRVDFDDFFIFADSFGKI